MSTYDPLAAVQDESVNAVTHGVSVSGAGLSIETGLLPRVTGTGGVRTQAIPGQIPWGAIALAGGVGVVLWLVFAGGKDE